MKGQLDNKRYELVRARPVQIVILGPRGEKIIKKSISYGFRAPTSKEK